AFEYAVGQFQRTGFARAAGKNDGHQFVVTERGNARTLQLFARAIVLGELFHGAILKSSCRSGFLHASRPQSFSWPVPTRPTKRWIRPKVRSTRREPPAQIDTPPVSSRRRLMASNARRMP